MFFAIHAGRPKRQKVTESVRLGSKEYDNFIGSVREQEKNENSRFKKSERYKKRTVVVFFQGGSLYPGFFFRKLPAVLPERIDIPGEKDEDYSNDENKDTSPFSPGEV